MISEPPNIFGIIYRFDEGGPIRQSGDGYDRTFAEPVLSEMLLWDRSRVMVEAGTEQQCVIYAHWPNDQYGSVLVYNVQMREWFGPFTLRNPFPAMIPKESSHSKQHCIGEGECVNGERQVCVDSRGSADKLPILG